MPKTHPLTKVQLLLAILWGILFSVLTSVDESRRFILFSISMVPFTGLSLISIYLGWLMAVKKENIISPWDSFGIRFVEKIRGKQAAKKLILEYSKPSRKMLFGGLNLFSGLLCLIAAIAGIIVILRTL